MIWNPLCLELWTMLERFCSRQQSDLRRTSQPCPHTRDRLMVGLGKHIELERSFLKGGECLQPICHMDFELRQLFLLVVIMDIWSSKLNALSASRQWRCFCGSIQHYCHKRWVISLYTGQPARWWLTNCLCALRSPIKLPCGLKMGLAHRLKESISLA